MFVWHYVESVGRKDLRRLLRKQTYEKYPSMGKVEQAQFERETQRKKGKKRGR